MTARRVICEYIWLAGDHSLRSKTRVLNGYKLYAASDISDFPEWNFDGSSTNQASGLHSELRLKPAAVYTDPFRQNIINTTCLLLMKSEQRRQPYFVQSRANANLSFPPKVYRATGWASEYFINSAETTGTGFHRDDFIVVSVVVRPFTARLPKTISSGVSPRGSQSPE